MYRTQLFHKLINSYNNFIKTIHLKDKILQNSWHSLSLISIRLECRFQLSLKFVKLDKILKLSHNHIKLKNYRTCSQICSFCITVFFEKCLHYDLLILGCGSYFTKDYAKKYNILYIHTDCM